MGWKEWEEEHGSDRDKDPSDYTAVTPYMVGDPLCSEYERFCGVGADILKALLSDHNHSHGPERHEIALIRTKLCSAYSSWENRVKQLAALLESAGEDEKDSE